MLVYHKHYNTTADLKKKINMQIHCICNNTRIISLIIHKRGYTPIVEIKTKYLKFQTLYGFFFVFCIIYKLEIKVYYLELLFFFYKKNDINMRKKNLLQHSKKDIL